jgi:uncharacterized membrane protein
MKLAIVSFAALLLMASSLCANITNASGAANPTAPMDWKMALLAVSIVFIIIAIIIFLLTGKKEQLHEAAVEGNRGLSEDEDRFLLILYENEGTIGQAELSRQSSWPEAKASLLAKSLESQGYVKRISKGRKSIVKATEKGNAFNRQRRQ